MIVCKFGGSSLSTSKKINIVSEILINKLKNNNVTSVFSAMGHTTNNILLCAEKSLECDETNYKNTLNELKCYTIVIIKHNIWILKKKISWY